MKVSQFDSVIKNTPRFVARFKMTRLPTWINNRIEGPERNVEVGEHFLVFFREARTMVRASNGHRFTVVPSTLEFIDYVPVTDKIPNTGWVSHE